ncbi:ketose-bisphosphate aldolase [Clostridium sp. KNHs216]|uniref:ketose-bisphosphate aldolase n=1 Tax=Clostridium sp. KNHs216 TaxID=1550235 RepID=UPI0011515666|nr:ketose-bisphosphate aldolase [Clostridium sp. KNHs216]TQI68427.1 fructose-bisphosphate aldolase [Clostridium sp. KNHs216]
MYQYNELGFVNTKEMFRKAYDGGYAVPAFNFISIEQLNAIMDACGKKQSPVIFIVSPNLRNQLGYEMIARVAQAGVDRLKNEERGVPVALHLDHGMTYEQCVSAIEGGFSSVMIDGSALPFEENIALTKKVVEYAHQFDVTVEGELGVLSGQEEEGDEKKIAGYYTDPAMVEEFVRRSGVDSLAVSVGTCHGLVKLKPNPDGSLPELRYDLLEDIQRRLPGFPIVLHGASTILPKYVTMINTYGGKLEQAVGIPEDQISKAAKMAVCKVNIASDGWIAALALTRKILAESPAAIDSRVFTLKVRPELAALYEHKIDVMGSENKA